MAPSFSNSNKQINPKINIRNRTYLFSGSVIKLVKKFPNSKLYWVFTDQLLRAATSIGANIVEAKSASSRRDFIKFYEIALKSCNETIYWLNLLKDNNLFENKEMLLLINEANQLCKMIGSSLITLKNKR